MQNRKVLECGLSQATRTGEKRNTPPKDFGNQELETRSNGQEPQWEKKYRRVATTGEKGNKMPCDPGNEHHIELKRQAEQKQRSQSFPLN